MGVTRKLITKNMYFIYILCFFFLPFLNLLIVAYVMKCLRFCDINKIFVRFTEMLLSFNSLNYFN